MFQFPQQLVLWICLILVPAPKSEPAPPSPWIGAWALDWGSIEQTTHLRADGTCWSPEYGGGNWSVDDDGYIWFSERDGAAQYVMWVDLLEGTGQGWSMSSDGQLNVGPQVKIRRGERLPAPRVVE